MMSPAWRLACVLIAIGVGWLVGTGSAIAVLFAALAVAVPVVGVPIRYRVGALVVAASCSRYSIDVAGFSLRPEHFAVALLVPDLLTARTTVRSLVRNRAFLVALFILIGLLPSLLATGDLAKAARIATMISIGLMAFMRVSPLSDVDRQVALRSLVKVAVVQGVLGVGATVSWYAFETTWGVQLEPTSGIPMAYSTFFEANLYGSFLAAALVLTFDQRAFRTTKASAIYAARGIIALGLLASFTRAAWVGLLVGLAVLTWRAARVNPGRAQRQPVRRDDIIRTVVGLAIVLTAVLTFSPTARTLTIERAANIVNFDTGTGEGRLMSTRLAIEEWKRAPFMGRGFGSFQGLVAGQRSGDSAWIPNLTAAVLHDAGIVGFLLVGSFLLRLVRRPTRRVGSVGAPGRDAWRLAVVSSAAVVSLVVAFQATGAFILVFPWIFFGIAAGDRVAGDQGAPETSRLQSVHS